ncbi:MAG: hypothetical protein ACLTM6_15750, partial [Eggerthella lenta]
QEFCPIIPAREPQARKRYVKDGALPGAFGKAEGSRRLEEARETRMELGNRRFAGTDSPLCMIFS